MQQFTFLVAAALSAAINDLKENLIRLDNIVEEVETSKEKYYPLQLNSPSTRFRHYNFMSNYLVMSPAKIVALYRAEVAAILEQMEGNVRFLNDDSAATINARFQLQVPEPGFFGCAAGPVTDGKAPE